MLGCFLLIVVPYERIFYSLSWWQMIIIMPLPVMIALSIWLSKLNPLLNKETRIPLLITEGFHVFFIISALYVWIATGVWAYTISSAVPLMPLVAYNVRSMVLSRKVQLQIFTTV
jgi:hypothetical protein